MWVYEQKTGLLIRRTLSQWGTPKSAIVGTGYSGQKEGLNSPDHEGVKFIGPLPQSPYLITEFYDDTNGKGLIAARLIPITFGPNRGIQILKTIIGRSGFMIHGDNSTPAPFDASEGCIILTRDLRIKIRDSGDNILLVESGVKTMTLGVNDKGES